MSRYIYNDEDNAPMNDPFDGPHNPTVYIDRSHMAYYESAQYDRDMENMENARDIMRSQLYEGFLDDMEFPRGGACRVCAWIREGIMEQFDDREALEDGCFPGFVYDLAYKMCAVCNAHKDDSKEDRDRAIQEFLEKEEI